MKAKKYKHLSFEDRCIIEEFLNNNYNFTKIDNLTSSFIHIYYCIWVLNRNFFYIIIYIISCKRM